MARSVVIVEDETVAAATLRKYLDEEDHFELVGSAATGPDAVDTIDEKRPDVVLLDVELPELSGVEVLLRADHDPAVIFTTAYDDHAVTAFELGAFDYLVKPFGRERFRQALERLGDRLEMTSRGGAGPSASDRAAETMEEADPLERLFVRTPDDILPVHADEIVRLEASGDYVRVHRHGDSHLISLSMSELERRLDTDRFLRVHRSHIVNADHIERIEKEDERRLRLYMSDGSSVVGSRSGSSALRDRIF